MKSPDIDKPWETQTTVERVTTLLCYIGMGAIVFAMWFMALT